MPNIEDWVSERGGDSNPVPPSRPLLSRKEVDADLRDAQRVGNIAALPILGGLHHQYVRV